MPTKIKLLTSLAGFNYSHKAGSIVAFEDAEALRHISGGNARALDAVETAMEGAREKALAEAAQKATAPPTEKATAKAK